MSPKSDAIRLRHMIDAARKAIDFCKSAQRRDLDRDEKLTLALVRLVEIIGEAATKVSSEVKKRHPAIPWNDIIGTRNKLIHGYDDVNLDILWQIVSVDLPSLMDDLHTALRTEAQSDQEVLNFD